MFSGWIKKKLVFIWLKFRNKLKFAQILKTHNFFDEVNLLFVVVFEISVFSLKILFCVFIKYFFSFKKSIVNTTKREMPNFEVGWGREWVVCGRSGVGREGATTARCVCEYVKKAAAAENEKKKLKQTNKKIDIQRERNSKQNEGGNRFRGGRERESKIVANAPPLPDPVGKFLN